MASSLRAAYQLRTPDSFEQGEIRIQGYSFPAQDARLNRALDHHASGGRDRPLTISSSQGSPFDDRDRYQRPTRYEGMISSPHDVMSSILTRGIERMNLRDDGYNDAASSTAYDRRDQRSTASRSKPGSRLITYDYPDRSSASETSRGNDIHSSTSRSRRLSAYGGSHSKLRYAHSSAYADDEVIEDDDDRTVTESRARHRYPVILPDGLPRTRRSEIRDDDSISPSDSVSQASSRRSSRQARETEAWSEISRGRPRRRPGSVLSSSTLRPPQFPGRTYVGAPVELYGDLLVKDITPR